MRVTITPDGLPPVVVPFLLDQVFWRWRVAKLVAGPEAEPHKKLTYDRLAAAILRAATAPDMEKRARLLGERFGRRTA
jgi:UDP:flavonoid glycosyltransferase YjiC (YdhE family)